MWIAEDVEQIRRGVANGDWIDGSLAVASVGLDGLALASDPIGTVLQYGITWLIEHVRPLSEALDWLAGDPGGIATQAQTWRTTGESLRHQSDAFAHAVRLDVDEWTGSAADAYRVWADQRRESLLTLAKTSETIALIMESAGALIGSVRMMVRDAVATVVSRLISYAVELVATGGLLTPLVAEQVSTLCAARAAQISRWLRGLIASLRDLLRYGGRLGDIIERIRASLASRHGAGPHEVPPVAPKKIGGPKDFDPQELRGQTPEAVGERIPDNWQSRPSRRGAGVVYFDPDNRGRQIRVMPGYPPHSRPDPMTWGPYVEVCQNGRTIKLPLFGNPTL